MLIALPFYRRVQYFFSYFLPLTYRIADFRIFY